MPNAMSAPRTSEKKRAKNGKRKARPTWEIVDYFPKQGNWSEYEYLDLPEDGPRAELVDGFLEFLPMPQRSHELILEFIFFAMRKFVIAGRLGEIFRSGRRLKLRNLNIREPDIVFVPFSKVDPSDENYALGADLVLEIVSGTSKDRERDWVDKFQDYAAAGIEEYWIVDPQLKTISVLNLKDGTYGVRKDFKSGERAASNTLKGFEVDVTEALAGFKFPR